MYTCTFANNQQAVRSSSDKCRNFVRVLSSSAPQNNPLISVCAAEAVAVAAAAAVAAAVRLP